MTTITAEQEAHELAQTSLSWLRQAGDRSAVSVLRSHVFHIQHLASANDYAAVAQVHLERLVEALRPNHTDDCIKRIVHRLMWEAARPNHCATCQGEGVFDDSDPSVGMWGWAPCSDCTEQGKCPWCGRLFMTEAQIENGDDCACACGYQYSCTESKNRIPVVDCCCWCAKAEAEMEAMRDELDRLDAERQAYNYVADDLAYQAQRERQAFGRFRGRD
jgi:hypothetical protein